MKVGLISDTHGLLRPEALRALEGVSHIIHAGDIGAPWIVPKLRELAPVSAIRGNVDLEEWAEDFPETLTVSLDGITIHVLHDLARLAPDPPAPGIALLVFGHTHRPLIERGPGALRINPGSAGPRRFRLPVTLATIVVTAGGVAEPRIVPLLP